MASTYIQLPATGGGPGAGVSSFNSRTGSVVSQSGDYGASQISYNNGTSGLAATEVQAAIDELATGAGIPGPDNALVWKNGSGLAESIPQFGINSRLGLSQDNDVVVDNTGGFSVNTNNLSIEPTVNSPADTVNLLNVQIDIDPNSDGFFFGTGGTALQIQGINVTHNGTSDVGNINFIANNFSIGNGTDALTLNGFGYAFGFGTINNNVTVTGGMQGYGYQPNVQSGATLASTSYTNAFYDFANIDTPSGSYTSGSFGPSITEIVNNGNYTGVLVNPNIDDFTGNAGASGLVVAGNWGTFATGGFSGLNVNPNIDSVNYATGIQVDMSNVTPSPGTFATLVIQDLTITAAQYDNTFNSVTFEYIGGGTAGSEVVSGSIPAFTVQIESGVSTALQVQAALQAYGPLVGGVTVTVSGVGSNPQVTQAATSMAGNVNPGQVEAAYFNGDVRIDGALSFTGGLSIGALTSFATYNMVSGTGNPASIDTLITQPTVAANANLTLADLLAVNTAMLLNVGANATVTTSFLGVTALGLPAVVNMSTGSSVDRVGGAVFAISLDAGATGGTINEVDLCRSIAIPNGATTVNRLVGYLMDLPFGDPATTSWGLYVTPSIENFMAGSLKIGGADTVTNSSVALEVESTTKALLLSRMTSAERDALTAVDGMLIYNTTTSKLQGREGGAWVNLV